MPSFFLSYAVIPAKAGTHFQPNPPSFFFFSVIPFSFCRHSHESGNPFSTQPAVIPFSLCRHSFYLVPSFPRKREPIFTYIAIQPQ